MATYASIATGLWSSSGTWGLVDSTSYQPATNGTTSVTTTATDSSTFIPGAITVDGIGVRIGTRSGTTGTVTVALRNITDSTTPATVTLTLATSMLDVVPGWVFFKFASPVLLVAGKSYSVRLSTSNAAQLTAFTNGTASNWTRYLRTTTAGATPTTGDDAIITSALSDGGSNVASVTTFTVTYDSTSTNKLGNFSISNGSTCTVQGTTSTAYYLHVGGDIRVEGTGVLNCGTSGTPLSSTSSFTVEITSVVPNGFGFACASGTINLYGAVKTTWAYLDADVSASATSLTLNSAPSGWAVGDTLAIASTTRTITDCEAKAITSVSGVTIGVAALTSAHGGNSTTKVRAEVMNLTRNIVIKGTDNTNPSYFNTSQASNTTMHYVELANMGGASVTKRGLDMRNATTAVCDVQFCSIHDFTTTGSLAFNVTATNSDNINFNGNVVYNIAGSNTTTGTFLHVVASTAGTSSKYTNNVFMLATVASVPGVYLLDLGASDYSGNTVVGSPGRALNLAESTVPTGSFDNWTIHSCSSSGFLAFNSVQGPFTVNNLLSYRNTAGIGFDTNLGGYNGWTFTNANIFGNSTAGIFLTGRAFDLKFKSCTIDGGTTLVQTRGVVAQSTFVSNQLVFESCSFAPTNQHTTDDIGCTAANTGFLNCLDLLLTNCTFGSTTLFSAASQALLAVGSIVRIVNRGSNNVHRAFTASSQIDTDTTIFWSTDIDSIAERLTHLSGASAKAESSPLEVACVSGSTVAVTVAVRKSAVGDGAAYNGAQQRLILKANPTAGIANDVVLATASAATGTWETLSGTSSAPTIDTILRFVVDSDGTAGWVDVDAWKPN